MSSSKYISPELTFEEYNLLHDLFVRFINDKRTTPQSNITPYAAFYQKVVNLGKDKFSVSIEEDDNAA